MKKEVYRMAMFYTFFVLLGAFWASAVVMAMRSTFTRHEGE